MYTVKCKAYQNKQILLQWQYIDRHNYSHQVRSDNFDLFNPYVIYKTQKMFLCSSCIIIR